LAENAYRVPLSAPSIRRACASLLIL
jgi:hypothetical protein